MNPVNTVVNRQNVYRNGLHPNMIQIENLQVINNSLINERQSLSNGPIVRSYEPMIFKELDRAYNDMLKATLILRDMKSDDIMKFKGMITPKASPINGGFLRFNVTNGIISKLINTKIIIPLQNNVLKFKLESKGLLRRKRELKSNTNQKNKKNMKNDILDEKSENTQTRNEIENDIDMKSSINSPLVQINETKVNVNVNITNYNININDHMTIQKIISEIKRLLLEKGYTYNSSHHVKKVYLMFSFEDMNYLIRKGEGKLAFLKNKASKSQDTILPEFNHDHQMVITQESKIIKELWDIREKLKKC